MQTNVQTEDAIVQKTRELVRNHRAAAPIPEHPPAGGDVPGRPRGPVAIRVPERSGPAVARETAPGPGPDQRGNRRLRPAARHSFPAMPWPRPLSRRRRKCARSSSGSPNTSARPSNWARCPRKRTWRRRLLRQRLRLSPLILSEDPIAEKVFGTAARRGYATAPVKTARMPPGIPYIVGNEAAERFSFTG